MRREIVEAVREAFEQAADASGLELHCDTLTDEAATTAARTVLWAVIEAVKADICPCCARGDFITLTGWHYPDIEAARRGQGGEPCKAWPIMQLSCDLAAGGTDGE